MTAHVPPADLASPAAASGAAAPPCCCCARCSSSAVSARPSVLSTCARERCAQGSRGSQRPSQQHTALHCRAASSGADGHTKSSVCAEGGWVDAPGGSSVGLVAAGAGARACMRLMCAGSPLTQPQPHARHHGRPLPRACMRLACTGANLTRPSSNLRPQRQRSVPSPTRLHEADVQAGGRVLQQQRAGAVHQRAARQAVQGRPGRRHGRTGQPL